MPSFVIFLTELITVHCEGRGVLLILLFSNAFIAGDTLNYEAESRIPVHDHLTPTFEPKHCWEPAAKQALL